jgi:hypothetical protein
MDINRAGQRRYAEFLKRVVGKKEEIFFIHRDQP